MQQGNWAIQSKGLEVAGMKDPSPKFNKTSKSNTCDKISCIFTEIIYCSIS